MSPLIFAAVLLAAAPTVMPALEQKTGERPYTSLIWASKPDITVAKLPIAAGFSIQLDV
ncbi:hypothetical protein N9329_02470 [Gammaproteobacteria bacterium]|jgi:hypothetical protein|nr:hypothetical protein [Gammaproteobacteria bacterium]